ncbi:MAG TPA: hypothetical protein VD861_13155 [Pyrinomonadaceae bacterium]|nr:hypothetical protein [Pyrinomonadaceae bacterium]
MAAKLSVIFYIILCIEVGLVLTLLPWMHVVPFLPTFGLGDWGDNYFLLYAAQKTGIRGLQTAVSSGWVRGAVSGLGLLNLAIAAWEIAHFKQTVSALEAGPGVKPSTPRTNAAKPATTDYLPDHERRDDAVRDPGR